MWPWSHNRPCNVLWFIWVYVGSLKKSECYVKSYHSDSERKQKQKSTILDFYSRGVIVIANQKPTVAKFSSKSKWRKFRQAAQSFCFHNWVSRKQSTGQVIHLPLSQEEWGVRAGVQEKEKELCDENTTSILAGLLQYIQKATRGCCGIWHF